MTQQPVTVGECIALGAARFDEAGLFFGHGTDNAEDEALWLVFHHLGIGWDSDESVFQRTVEPNEWLGIKTLFDQRIEKRIPAAYLCGEAWFAGFPFEVNESVLVPRSPIAELIVNGYQPWLSNSKSRILDLCTGSGCIGIASALYLPEVEVILSDISPAAIDIARHNIQRHGLQQRVSAVISDGLQAFELGSHPGFDLIVSNPPYVDAADFAAMPAEYQAEPELGLVSGEDGLDFTRQLLAQAASHLNDEGILIVEVGNSWEALEQSFPSLPFTWLEFSHGGHGVFVLTKEQLLEHQTLLG